MKRYVAAATFGLLVGLGIWLLSNRVYVAVGSGLLVALLGWGAITLLPTGDPAEFSAWLWKNRWKASISIGALMTAGVGVGALFRYPWWQALILAIGSGLILMSAVFVAALLSYRLARPSGEEESER